MFGLICNLVLHDSVNFVGKSGTTYTSYIQRNRNQKEIETWDFFDNPPKAIAEPYSWNNYPLDNDLNECLSSLPAFITLLITSNFLTLVFIFGGNIIEYISLPV